MAGLMLASAFSVADAQNVVKKYETSKTYWLGLEDNTSNGTKVNEVIAVVSNPQSDKYGQLILVGQDQLNDINAVKAATWSITFTQPTDGTAPKFVYVNKATGLTLSVDPDAEGEAAYIKGNSSEWLNTSITDNTGANSGAGAALPFAPLRSFYEANKAVYLKRGVAHTSNNKGSDFFGNTDKDNIEYVELVVATAEKMATLTGAISIAPAQPVVYSLSANDLNSQLGKIDLDIVKDSWFNLYFNQDVTSDAKANLFAATQLQAVQIYYDGDVDASITNDDKANFASATTTSSKKKNGDENVRSAYVKLLAKDMDGAYITVDTAYHKGTETVGKLPSFTYAKRNYEGTNNVPRLEASSHFAFAYDPFEDKVMIKSRAYFTKTLSDSNAPYEISGTGVTADGNKAYTRWGYNKSVTSSIQITANNVAVVNNGYVRLAKLASVRELTVSTNKAGVNDADVAVGTWTKNPTKGFSMETTVKMSLEDQTFSPATIADGLYLIKLHTSGYDKDGNKRKEANGDYLIASLAGTFGYAEQARNQNFDHMPAAQWYVKQNGSSATSPVSITNREFFDVEGKGLNKENIQLFNAGDGRVFFTGTEAFANDTLEFIPVSAASKADANLGYKYVDEKQASVETYYFNYLSGLAQDKGLNTPINNDSLVRVDETGDKIALRLIPVTKDDSYGIQLDEKKTGIKNLVRNAYYIQAYDDVKFAADGRKRYLSYEPASKKYVMSLVPEMFFLKENNDIDGTHYYALVKAEGYGVDVLEKKVDGAYTVNKEKYAVNSKWNGRLLRYNNGAKGLVTKMYPAEYKGMSLIDDATKVWSFIELATLEKRPVTVNGKTIYINNYLTPEQMTEVKVIFYDKDGEPIVSDATEGVDLYAYMPNGNNVITLQPVTTNKNASDEPEATKYYAMNPINDDTSFQYGIDFKDAEGEGKPLQIKGVSKTTAYAGSRISVDDNTLDLFKADLENQTWENELRVSAFEAQVNDSPLYRRFNGANGEFGTADNAPLNLKFYRYNNDQEFLFENYASDNKYRDGINDKEISFLGVNNAMQFAESETRSYTMYVDTAYVRANTRMPQYLIGIRPEIVEGDTTLCDASTHAHKTPEEALACEHTTIKAGFTRAMYLFNAQDSVDVKNYDYQGKVAYGAQGYTRLAFKDAVHANDTLFILNPGVTTEALKACDLKDGKLFSDTIALGNNNHKNVVFQFRLVGEDNNRFLIESESDPEMIAPEKGGWVKIQNGVPVIVG